MQLGVVPPKRFLGPHWQFEDMISEGDKVLTCWTGSGTHKAVLQGNPPIPPTGKQASVLVHRITGGKIVESWNVWDTLGLLRRLDMIPS